MHREIVKVGWILNWTLAAIVWFFSLNNLFLCQYFPHFTYCVQIDRISLLTSCSRSWRQPRTLKRSAPSCYLSCKRVRRYVSIRCSELSFSCAAGLCRRCCAVKSFSLSNCSDLSQSNVIVESINDIMLNYSEEIKAVSYFARWFYLNWYLS